MGRRSKRERQGLAVKQNVVPRARLELARGYPPTDFKSVASAIPPPRLLYIAVKREIKTALYGHDFYMEATSGFEPLNKGFADPRLKPLGYVADIFNGAEEGIQTLDPLLGKEMLYR